MRRLIIALSACAFALSAAPSIASAAAVQCRDARGKFTRCPAKTERCRDTRGKFIACMKK